MKILEINKFFYAKRGADKHFIDVIDLLKSHGHEVAVFSMANPKNNVGPWNKYFVSYAGYLPQDSFWERLKGLSRIYSFESRRKIKKLLDDFQPDVAHIHNIYHQISPSILPILKKRGIPVVMTVHDYSLISPNYDFAFQETDWEKLGRFRSLKFIFKKGFKDSYAQSFLALLEYWFLRLTRIYENNVDLFIAPSIFLKNKLVCGGIDEKKIIVLPHFGKFNPDLKQEEENFVFHFGALSKAKGTQDIIEIFKDLKNIELRLAGSLEEGLDFKSCPNIKYLGFLNQKELQKQIQRSMFVISASGLPETFGLVALETLENSKPFVALQVGAYGEIVENGKEGYLCQNLAQFREKIILLVKDRELREKMAKNALEKAKKFNPGNYLREFQKIIDFLSNKC